MGIALKLVTCGAALGILSKLSIMQVSGNSMEPVITNGSWVLILKIPQTCQLGDLVVAKIGKRGDLVLKRLTQLSKGNEHITLGNMNGTIAADGFLKQNEPLDKQLLIEIHSENHFIHSHNECFAWIEGVSRASHDSRNFGWIPCTCLVGKLLVTLVKG